MVRIYKKIFIIIFITLLTLNANSDEVNWKIYESNNFLSGQILGCLIRIEVYTELTTPFEGMDVNDAVKSIYTNLDIKNLKEKFFDISYKNGSINEQFTKDDFQNFISDFAKEEFSQGMSWLQSAGCYKMFVDHNFIK